MPRLENAFTAVLGLSFSALPLNSLALDIQLGFLYQQSPTSWLQESWSQFKLAVQDVNADPSLLPNHNLTYVLRDSEGNEQRALQGAIDLLYRSFPVQAVVGTGYSHALEAPALFCSVSKVPILSPGSTSISLSDKTRFPYLLRTLSNDGSNLKAMAVTIYEMGWRKAATLCNSAFEVGATQIFYPALKALGIEYLTLTYEAIDTQKGAVDLNNSLGLLSRAGFRVVALYAKTIDMDILDSLSRAKGLRTDAYSWIMLQAAFKAPWTTSSNVLAIRPSSSTNNPVRSAFVARWPSVATVYDRSVHGAWDPVTKMPFYGSNTYTSVIWDTDYAPVGNGAPDVWGMIVYDTVWVLAKAFHALIQAGGDPSDGASLRQRLLAVQHLGVSGDLAFDQATQDVLPQLQILITNGTMPPVLVARTTQLLGVGSLDDGRWCRSGCLNFSQHQLSALPWQGGRIPSDGRALDASKSDASVMDSAREGDRIVVHFTASDSFARPPCSDTCTIQSSSSCQACLREEAAYHLFQLEARDLHGAIVPPVDPVPPPLVDVSTGRGVLAVPRGFAGAGLDDRVLVLSLRHRGEMVRLSPQGPQRVTFRSPACEVGMAGPALSCVSCMPGTMAPSRGMASCTSCAAGRFQDLAGQQGCKNCTEGHFAAAEGTSECLSCPFGSYLGEPGGKGCESCPALMTTLLPGAISVRSCVCPAGLYRPLGALLAPGQASPCQPCPPGMECPAGSDARSFPGGPGGAVSTEYPLVLPGFWSSSAEPGSAYKCREGAEQCPGGPPETCGPRLEDRACAICEASWYRQGAVCLECPNQAISKILFPVIPIFLAFFFVVPFYIISVGRHDETAWNASWKSTPNLAALMLAHLQVAGIMLTCNLENKPQSTGRAYPWVNDVLGVLQLECAGVRDFDAQMTLKLLVPGYFCGVFIFVGAVSVPAGKVFGRLKMDLDVLWGCLGAAFMAFYITTCAISFNLFKCYEHPNGEQSIQSAPHVLCYHGEWERMIVLGMCAVVVYCGFSVALFAWVLWRAPKHMEDEAFTKRWRFLLSKFRPGCRWWSIFWLAKGLVLNLAQVVSIRGQNQILFIQTVIIVYLVTTCHFKPWRHVDVNRTDLLVHLGLAVACGQLYWYAEARGDDGGRKHLVDVLLGIPLSLGILFLLSRALVKVASSVTNLKAPAHTCEDLAELAEVSTSEGAAEALPKGGARSSSRIRTTCRMAEKVSGVYSVTNVSKSTCQLQTKFRAFGELDIEASVHILETLSETDRRVLMSVADILDKKVSVSGRGLRRESDASTAEPQEDTPNDFGTPDEVRLTLSSASDAIMKDIDCIGASPLALTHVRQEGLSSTWSLKL